MSDMSGDGLLAFLQGFFLLALVFQAALTDLRERKILNLPCLFALVAGLALAYARGGFGSLLPEPAFLLSAAGNPAAEAAGAVASAAPFGLLGSFMGAALLFIPFFLAWLAGGMGAGDAKLMAGVGALCGLDFSFWVLMHTAIAGAGVALVYFFWKRDFKGGMRRTLRSLIRWRWREKDSTEAGAPLSIPYAVAICLGVIWTIIFYSQRAPLPFF